MRRFYIIEERSFGNRVMHYAHTFNRFKNNDNFKRVR